ncbi:hypothetical protein ACFL1H_02435, partial [Nanoarchaeota archaeon]
MKRIIGIVIFLSMIFLAMNVVALNGPYAIHREDVTVNNFLNSTTVVTGTGYIDVVVPNVYDTLQYLRFTLSGTAGTNLLSNIAYRNVAASPSLGSTTRMLVDTDAGNGQLYYTINDSGIIPYMSMNVTWLNKEGGTDLHGNDHLPQSHNDVLWTITLSNPGSQNLTNVDFLLQFNTSTDGLGSDAVNITTTNVGVANAVVSDSDTDFEFDRVTWTGNLTQGQTLVFTFNTTIEEQVNFDGTRVNVNGITYQIGARANYSEIGTFTGINITDLFSRASIREGIDLILAGNTWRVRGLIKNIAQTSGVQLSYIIHNWSLYEINPTTGQPLNTPNISYTGPDPFAILTPNDERFTDWFDTNGSNKPYYSSYWDWEVKWNNQTDICSGADICPSSSTIAYLELPVLLMLDHDTSTSTLNGYLLPDTVSNLYPNIELKHVGDPTLNVTRIDIFSVVPRNSTQNNVYGNWQINTSSIRAYIELANSTLLEINLTGPGVTLTTANPSAGAEGYVHLDITNISTVYVNGNLTYGEYFQVNDKIILDYQVTTSNDVPAGEVFEFTGNSTTVTVSGTPNIEALLLLEAVAAEKRLVGYKDLRALDPNNPTFINATIRLDAVDKSNLSDGIAGIRVTDYVSNGTDFDPTTAIVTFYNGTQWFTWTYGVEYNVTDKGWVTLSDGHVVRAYEYYDNASNSVWDGTLYDGQALQIDYQMNLTTEGVYVLPAQIVAIDPSTGETFDINVVGVVVVSLSPNMLDFVITESAIKVAASVNVGKPVLWTKNFEVYNPNDRATHAQFKSKIADDSIEAYVSYYNDLGEQIEEVVDFDMLSDGKYIFWETTIGAFETRVYEVRVLTPPVLEVDRDVEVIDKIDDKFVKLKMSIYVKNFAEEPYENIRLTLPMSNDQIISIKDAFGQDVEYIGGENSVVIVIPKLDPDELKTLEIVYRASYPTVIVTPNRDRYELDAEVTLDVLIINGGEKVLNPRLESEVYDPYLNTVHTTIIDVNSLEPLEKTETYDKFSVPANAVTGMYAANVKLREDFTTLSEGTGTFFVSGVRSNALYILELIAIFVVAGILMYVNVERGMHIHRRKKSSKSSKKDTNVADKKQE